MNNFLNLLFTIIFFVVLSSCQNKVKQEPNKLEHKATKLLKGEQVKLPLSSYSSLIDVYGIDSIITRIEVLLDVSFSEQKHIDDFQQLVMDKNSKLNDKLTVWIIFPNDPNDVYNKKSKFSTAFSTEHKVQEILRDRAHTEMNGVLDSNLVKAISEIEFVNDISKILESANMELVLIHDFKCAIRQNLADVFFLECFRYLMQYQLKS